MAQKRKMTPVLSPAGHCYTRATCPHCYTKAPFVKWHSMSTRATRRGDWWGTLARVNWICDTCGRVTFYSVQWQPNAAQLDFLSDLLPF